MILEQNELYPGNIDEIRSVDNSFGFLHQHNFKSERMILITDESSFEVIRKSPLIINKFCSFVDLTAINNNESWKDTCNNICTRIKDLLRSHSGNILIKINGLNCSLIFNLVNSLKVFQIEIKAACKFFNVVTKKVFSKSFKNLPLINVYSPSRFYFYPIVKRLFDILFSFVVLILLIPLFICVGILIKLTSKGSIIFKQQRIGKNFRPFYLYKFRTMNDTKGEDEERKKMMIEFMKNNKQENCGKKIVNGSRVTRIGKLLRKTSIDEFPQLFNVLKGNMSLIGPRPELPYVFENYEEWQKKRFDILPGCTGVWQVWGRSSVNFNDSILMDIFYVNNFSPLLDFKIFIKTFPVLIFGIGGE